MPPRRNYAAPRRASKSSTLPKLQHMTTTIRSAALRAWKNSPSRNIYLGGAAMIAVIAVFMRHFLSPTFPIPSKGVVLVTGEVEEQCGLNSYECADEAQIVKITAQVPMSADLYFSP